MLLHIFTRNSENILITESHLDLDSSETKTLASAYILDQCQTSSILIAMTIKYSNNPNFTYVIIVSLFLSIWGSCGASAQTLVLRDHLGGSWSADDVDYYENWAYYINQEGIAIIDITNPGSPHYHSFFDTPGTGYGLKVSYPYLFVAAGEAGLVILSILTPSSPTLVGSLPTEGPALRVDNSVNYAFVAMGESGIANIDITNPASPSLAGTYNTPGAALDLAIYGYNIFVADAEAGLQVIDISNPASPSAVSSLALSGRTSSIVHYGNNVYVACGEYGFQVIDVLDPAHPAALTSSHASPGEEIDVSIGLGTNILASLNRQEGLRLINTDTYVASWIPMPGEGEAAKVMASPLPYALVASGYRGLNIINTDTSSRIGFYDNPGQAMGVDAFGNYAFVADSYSGVMAINVSNPESVYTVAVYDTPGQAYGVKVDGLNLFVADGDQGLKILDAYSPASSFSLLGEIDTPGDAYGVEVVGNTAYVADGESGLRIIDVTNPAAPREVGSYNSPGDVRDVVIQRGYAYLADGTGGLRVVDISDSASPRSLSSIATSGFSFGIAMVGDYALLADCTAGLRIIDAHNPLALAEVAHYQNSQCARKVAVNGNYAYVAFSAGGLVELDISDTRHPRVVAEQAVPNYSAATGVAVANGNVFLGVEGDGLRVYAAETSIEDTDHDGVSDVEEASDGTDPRDAGSNMPELETSLCSEWNGFLNMWNIMEHVNMSSSSLRVSSTIYTIDGSVGETRNFNIGSGAQQDLLVHDMAQHQDNSYGKICSNISGGSPGDLDGRMVYYKAVSDGGSGYNFDFAFAMPFQNGLTGSQFVPYNTYQPSLDPSDGGNLVANWIQVTNLSSSSAKGSLIFYDMAGVVIQSRSVSLRAGARQDISGHDIVGTSKVGIAEWRPENIGAKFQLRNVRYYYQANGVNFDGAFQLEGAKGNGQKLVVSLDAKNGSAILEISNVLSRSVKADIYVYDRYGTEVRHERRTLGAYQSYHMIADSVLSTVGTGIATIQGDVSDSLIVTAMHYFRNSSLGLNSIYGVQAQQPLGTVLRGSYNTFLGQGCLLRLANPTGADLDVSYRLTRYDGTDVLGGDNTVTVSAKGMYDVNICGMESPNVYGVVRVQPAFANSIVANVLRIGPNEQYRFPTPVRE